MIHWLQLSPTDQIFTHFDPETGKQIDIAVSAITRWCEKTHQEIFRTPIQESHIATIAEQDGRIEPHRLLRLKGAALRAPILFLDWYDGHTKLLADGNHRYVRHYQLRRPEILTYVVAVRDWEPFIVQGLPKTTEAQMLKSFSGVF